MEDSKPDYSEFNDQRLAPLYDALNALGEDSNFFCSIAKRLSAKEIIDLGCGTGLLTCELAKLGFKVTGIEPASAMLELAKQKPYADQVTWIQGSSEQMEGLEADLVLMTSHVAQFFLEDAEWNSMLKAAHKTLRPNGHIVFDSRNPLTKPWKKWTRQLSSSTLTALNGKVETWCDLLEIKGNHARYEIHYLFANSGEELVSINELIYRSQDEIAQSLVDAGFTAQKIYGNWDESPALSGSPEMIFVGTKA